MIAKLLKTIKKVFPAMYAKLHNLYLRYTGRPAALRRAIKRAKRLHTKSGTSFLNRKRYRVFFFGYRYHVWDRSDIRERQKNKLFKEGLKAGQSFDQICFFDTNSLQESTIKA